MPWKAAACAGACGVADSATATPGDTGASPEGETAGHPSRPVASRTPPQPPRRRADASGNVSLSNRNRYAGAGLKGRAVYATLDPREVAWVFQGKDGTCYRRRPAEELSAERIRALQVTNRRDRHPPARPANPDARIPGAAP